MADAPKGLSGAALRRKKKPAAVVDTADCEPRAENGDVSTLQKLEKSNSATAAQGSAVKHDESSSSSSSREVATSDDQPAHTKSGSIRTAKSAKAKAQSADPAAASENGNSDKPSSSQPKLPSRRSPSSSNAEGSSVTDKARPSSTPPSTPSAAARVPPKEEPRVQELRRKVHALRVLMMRAALRLGWEEHYVHQVMYRLQFAENLQLPKQRNATGPRPDPVRLAIKEAEKAEEEQGGNSQLDLKMTILLVGLEGGGKTSLAGSILHSGEEEPGPIPASTERVSELHGSVAGVAVRVIDTPGLSLDARKVHQNMMRLKQIRRAYKKYKPDTIIFVDRLDRKQGGDEELAVLRSLTSSLDGPSIWSNTVVAFTRAGGIGESNGVSHAHANGASTSEPRAPSWQVHIKQKEVGLQKLIRTVSGDPRLMNPVLWVENGTCEKNAAGQPVVFEGHPWRQHMYLMLLSAKILAECEALFGLQTIGKPNAAARMQDSGPPLQFLLQSLTTINDPLRYPERATVELRKLKHKVRQAPTAWSRKKARLEVASACRQLKVQERYRMSIMKSKVDRIIFAPGPRSTTDPKITHRYVAVMASDKEGCLLSRTIARPQIDNRLVFDHGDGIVGIQLEHGAVLRAKEIVTDSTPMDGIPTTITCAAQAGKDRMLVQARCEASVQHDLLERNITGLTMDVQTNGSVQNMSTLYNVQIDKHLRGFPSRNSSITAGALISRYAPRGLPHQGPSSLGMRLQSKMPMGIVVKGCPLLLGWCLGQAFSRINGENESGWGGTAELKFDPAEGSRSGPPLTLSASVLNSKAGVSTGGALNWQTQIGRHKYGAMAQVMDSKGRLKVRARMSNSYWLVAVGVLPLAVQLYHWLRKRWLPKKAKEALPDTAQAQKLKGKQPA